MFDNLVSVMENDKDQSVYIDMVNALEKEFLYMSSVGKSDITNQKDFIRLYEITQTFYKEVFPEIYDHYVPLYSSLWKQRLKDLLKIDNIHQDGGIHYFSKNGYQSRMITVWTNIYKDEIEGLSPSDMGVFVIDNDAPCNVSVYEKMEKENTHFHSKREGELTDNMYIGGAVIKCNTGKLKRRYFDFKEGTSIQFNSHLLHGSKTFDLSSMSYSPEELNKFRVSLTGVWIHKDDLDMTVVNMPESEHEKLFMCKQDKESWSDIKSYFGAACKEENARLINIKKLINIHI